MQPRSPGPPPARPTRVTARTAAAPAAGPVGSRRGRATTVRRPFRRDGERPPTGRSPQVEGHRRSGEEGMEQEGDEEAGGEETERRQLCRRPGRRPRRQGRGCRLEGGERAEQPVSHAAEVRAPAVELCETDRRRRQLAPARRFSAGSSTSRSSSSGAGSQRRYAHDENKRALPGPPLREPDHLATAVEHLAGPAPGEAHQVAEVPGMAAPRGPRGRAAPSRPAPSTHHAAHPLRRPDTSSLQSGSSRGIQASSHSWSPGSR